MKAEQILEVQSAANAAAVDVVKNQIAKGAPNRGMSKARHVAVVADTLHEILASYEAPTGEDAEKFQRELLRAALSGSLLNASQFRQELEKSGILVKETALSNEYGID